MRDLLPFEILLYSRHNLSKFKTASFAQCLIDAVKQGILKFGFVLPSVQQLSDLSGLSISSINRAFNFMVQEGYLTTENGKCGVIKDPSIKSPETVQDKAFQFSLDNVFMKPLILTARIHDFIHRYFKKHSAILSANLHDKIFDSLIGTLRGLINFQHRTAYQDSEVYYMHDYQSLIKIIGCVFFNAGECIIIPKVVDYRVRLGLKASKVKMFEVNIISSGYDLIHLEQLCSQKKAKVLYLMPELRFPDMVNMDREHLIQIIEIINRYKMQLVIDDRMRPWLTGQVSLMLALTDEMKERIIYLSPVSYLHEELLRINILAASSVFIDKVRIVANEHGKQAYYSTAFTVNAILQHPDFADAVTNTDVAVLEIKQKFLDVFTKSGLWKLAGLGPANVPVLYVIPKTGKFKDGAYELAKGLGIDLVNPTRYNTARNEIAGFRLELASLLDRHNMKSHVIELEKELAKLLS